MAIGTEDELNASKGDGGDKKTRRGSIIEGPITNGPSMCETQVQEIRRKRVRNYLGLTVRRRIR